MTRRSISGARAIVTGASSGIGYELAKELARQGARVVVTARREERLRELVAEIQARGGEATFVTGDITDAAVRTALLKETQARFGGLDILVNNAGIGAIGPFADAASDRLTRIMDVNFVAPAELTRRALPMLRAGNRPIIVNIGSVLGHRAVPTKSEYCASKFALHGWSDSLRAELVGQGVDVLLVSPSTTASEFFDHVLEGHEATPGGVFGQMSPGSVARKTVAAIRKGKHEIILSAGGKLLVWLDRLCPPLADWLVVHRA